MTKPFLSEINIYPIKSLGGIALKSSKVEERGLQYDRRWMLVDDNGKFITQREFPVMASISVSISDEGLTVNSLDQGSLLIPFQPEKNVQLMVQVWRSTCPALVYEESINQWFSKILNIPCKLAYMPEETRRSVNPEYDINNNIVSFADGYPFLLIGESSLRDLNNRLDTSIPMNRFRPNLVVSGTEDFAEDQWKEIIIGDITFFLVKPCDRCTITTIDQKSGKTTGKEPLKTLAAYRKINNKVLFGQNLISNGSGSIKTGDEIIINKYNIVT